MVQDEKVVKREHVYMMAGSELWQVTSAILLLNAVMFISDKVLHNAESEYA